MADDGMGDLTTAVLVEIRDELKSHRGYFEGQGRTLRRHTEVLEHHSTLLAQHGTVLAQHSERFERQERRLDALERTAREQAVTLRHILRAVEQGFANRDERSDDHERRLRKLEDRDQAEDQR